MFQQKEDNKVFRIYNRKIMKFLSKHKKTYDYDTINQFRNDIFIKLYNSKSKLPKKENELEKYIYITCKNYILDYKKTSKKYIEYTEDNEFLENSIYSNNIEEDYILHDHFYKKIKTLGDLKSTIIKYKYEGYTINEISKILKISRTKTFETFKKININDNI